jgi:preprotein translocase subunit SecG
MKFIIIILLTLGGLGVSLAYVGKLPTDFIWILTGVWFVTAIILGLYKKMIDSKNIFLKQDERSK